MTELSEKNNFSLIHLAYDEIDYEHWTIATQEWIQYFKQLTIESTNSSLNYSLQKREKFEEKVKLLQSKLYSNEAHLELIKNQNKGNFILYEKYFLFINSLDLNQQILDMEQKNRDKVKIEEEKITNDIKAQEKMIQQLYLELKQKESQLVAEETKTDQLMLLVSKDVYKLALVSPLLSFVESLFIGLSTYFKR